MNTAEEYSKFMVQTSWDDLTKFDVDRFKVRLLDSIGTIAAGVHAPGIDGAVKMMKGIGGAEEATVLYHGGKIPAGNASFLNSIMLRSFDFECCGNEFPDWTTGPAHITGSTMPCTLAAAEMTHASGKQAILANVLGDDLACRLAQGTGFDFDAGWDNTGTVNVLGCAVIASKLLELNAAESKDALGLAINYAGSTIDGVMDGRLAFKMPHGNSGMNGIFAARLAQAGFSGTIDAITGKHGYFDLFGAPNMDTGTVMRELGKTFYSDGGVKPWPSCRFTHSPIQSSLKIKNENDFDSKEIAAIQITLHHVAKLVDNPFEPPFEVPMFNLRFVVSCALKYGAFGARYHEMQYQMDEEIARLANMIEIVYDPPMEHTLSSTVKVTLADGRVFENHIYQPKGDFAEDPLDREGLLKKFYENQEYCGVLSQTEAEKVVEAIDNFEEFDDVRDFTAMLVK